MRISSSYVLEHYVCEDKRKLRVLTVIAPICGVLMLLSIIGAIFTPWTLCLTPGFLIIAVLLGKRKNNLSFVFRYVVSSDYLYVEKVYAGQNEKRVLFIPLDEIKFSLSQYEDGKRLYDENYKNKGENNLIIYADEKYNLLVDDYFYAVLDYGTKQTNNISR